MLRNFTWRRGLIVLLGVLSAPALVPFGMWLKEARPATKRGGQQPAEPFRMRRQLYYVGANDIAAFLITGPEGHAVLDGGYPTTALMIMASIARLGFDIKDVKVLLNSEPHRTPTTRAGWRRSNRRAAPSCGPATRARTPSPPAATTPTWYRGGISWVLSTYTNRLDMTAH